MNEEGECSRIDRDLSSPDEELRRVAVERLLELPSSGAIPCLVECLGDTSWRVRKAAVERIVARAESEEVAGALIEALSDGENPGRRNSAIEALIECGSRVFAPLIEALASPDVDVRKLLVDALAGIGDAAARLPMIEMLGDSDANVRAAAADALGELAGDDSVAALRAVVSRAGEDRLVRYSALHSLARLEVAIPVCELGDLLDDPVLGTAGLALLGYADDEESITCLLKGLSSSARACREAGMEALLRVLARLDGQAESAFLERLREVAGPSDLLISSAIERLEDADLSSRLVLVQFLGLLADPRAVIPILEVGSDEAISEVALATLVSLGALSENELDAHWSELDGGGQRFACQIFGRTRGESGTARLRSALRDSDSELRGAAAAALGGLRCVRALSDLVNALEVAANEAGFDAEEEVAALEGALVEIAGGGDADSAQAASAVIEALAELLDDSEDALRLSIATVLSQVCRPEDHEFVSRLQRDSSEQVRRVAVAGLQRLAPELAVERLRLALADESPIVRVAAAVALGRALQPEVTQDLQRLIADEDPRVCAAAVRAIGAQGSRLDDDEARSQCIQLIAPGLAGDGMVAMAAIEALAAVGGNAAARATSSVLACPEPELVQAAVACIGAHGDAESLAELLPLLSHPSWAVRADAIQVLGEQGLTDALPAILQRQETEEDGFVRDAIEHALGRLEG